MIWVRVVEAWSLAAGLQLVLWLVQQRTKNAAIVDVGWAASFTLVIALFAWRATAPLAAWLPIAIVVCTWSLRLAGYLVSRGALRVEEGRYVDLRARWGANASRNFFVFFQAQAALTGVLATAFVVPFVATPASDVRWLGIVVSAIGIVGEAVADAQLARFKATSRGVCDVGLWAWSRHPNYFFEWCVWIGFAIYGLAYLPWGAIALVGQAIIVASIFGVTGIPPTEKQAIRSKGDAYRDYQKRVSRFVPMPPKGRGSSA